jgi:hypothetical protein
MIIIHQGSIVGYMSDLGTTIVCIGYIVCFNSQKERTSFCHGQVVSSSMIIRHDAFLFFFNDRILN